MIKNASSQEIRRQKILEEIADNLMLKVPPALRESAALFAKIYYATVTLEDLMDNPLESLVDSVFGMWELSLHRVPGQVKIRAYSQKKEVKGHPQSQTIVEIINDDMPFIVDSVTGAINSLGYSTHLVIHPVMKIERDTSHLLKAVFPHTQNGNNGKNGKNGNYESIIYCEIFSHLSPKKLEALESEVSLALQDTRSAVIDWQEMQKHLRITIEDLKKNPPSVAKKELKETLSFLEWLGDNHFTFLGCCTYYLVPGQTTIQASLLPKDGLGILKDPLRQEISHIFKGVELSEETRRQVRDPHPLLITKTSEVARVHRRDPMDSIVIKKINEDGIVIAFHQFLGLFTSATYNKSVWDIPLLRQKATNIVKRSGFSEQWHDGKALIHILESFPRDELFQASEDWVFETCMGVLQLQNRQRLTLFIRKDRFGRFLSCLAYVPRELYDSSLKAKMIAIIEKNLQGTVTNWTTQFGEMAFARIHFILIFLQKGIPSYNLKALEDELLEASLTWRDHLRQALFNRFGEEKGQQLFDRYGKGFSKGYQELFTPEEAITDIHELEKTFDQSRLQAALRYEEGKDKSYISLKVYTPEKSISLSHILPILENMNFKVLSEIPFVINISHNQKLWLHDFKMRTRDDDDVELDAFRDYFLEAFTPIWHEEIENDGFNRLIVRANLKWQECQLLRVYAKYLRQLQVRFSQAYMEETLAKYPHICRLLVQLFTCKFDPNSKEDRERAQEEIINKIRAHLEKVMVLDEDRILNKFLNAIYSTLRTNYYQLINNKQKPYVSIKIDSKSIDEMPLPRPKYEIFIYSPHVEAIHLRGGRVARGGIRWSDRREDFRTEILGLMKAQTVKNAVIVPVGSKGGFIVKRPPLMGDPHVSLMDEVLLCYETMMRGLLDLTDNIKYPQFIPPQDVVRWDEDDPYLVVAADKGTATFSDFANSIAKEYGFWLGDAFASGGSSGYDHKKMGITAKGAWESVKRHFREMGIDANQEQITVIGIGDMAGDVFGNGMLLSQHLKLVAAFNHMHIFIDPSPDPLTSYEERKRLFNLPTSTWKDYNQTLISQGGGVFDRKAKTIILTPEMKTLFEIQEETLTPSELIRYLLKAPVDLIWLGGIGTFIKSSTEPNTDVGDRLNDSLRINGIEVRARVIAEGANLGVTQRGRIEYAKNGGRINTDAIDNSAGVDCSDHEVNLKILLDQVIKEGKLTFDERNQLLKEMTNDVARLVLTDNFWQNQVISFYQNQGPSLLAEQVRLMHDLESEGLLDRELEALPDEREIARRKADKQGLTRPELAVLLAYAKISLNYQLVHSELPDLDILQSRLLSYFPDSLQQLYKKEIFNHPLKRELTVTLFTNTLINRMGITFVHEMKRQLGVKGVDVIKAFLVVRDLLDLISLGNELESLESLPTSSPTELMLMIYENVKRLTSWFVKFDAAGKNVEEVIIFFKSDFATLQDRVASFFPSKQYRSYEEKHNSYNNLGFSESLAKRLLTLNSLVSAPDMIVLSKELQIDIEPVARVYFAVGQEFGFDWLRKTALNLSGETLWSQDAAHTLIEDFYINQRAITKKVLTSGKSIDHLFKDDGSIAEGLLEGAGVESILIDIMNASTVDFAMMTVINQRLRLLSHEDNRAIECK
jgi:glutamate dehydrogenase